MAKEEKGKDTVYISGTVPKWVEEKRREIAKTRFFDMRMSLSMALSLIMEAGIKALESKGEKK